jgi:hypothetical protein
LVSISLKQVLELLEGTDLAAAENIRAVLKEGHYRLIVNMSTATEGGRVSQTLGGVAYQYLNIHLGFFCAINFDAKVENSIRKMATPAY